MPSAVRALISTWVASGTLIATIFEPCRIQSSPSGCAVVETSCQSVTGRRLGRGQCNDRSTRDDLLKHRAGDLSAGATQETARHHDRVDVGLDH